MKRTGYAVASTAMVLMLVGGALGEEKDAAKAMYLRYCSACHGEGGKGDGVVSGLMKPGPSDLTQLAKQAGGTFPFMKIVRTIDGRDTVRAHGDPDMPVWGDIMSAEGGMTIADHAAARGKILLITEHLERIQAK